MKSAVCALVLIAGLAGCVGPNYTPPAAETAQLAVDNAAATDPDDKVTCRREHVVGSNRPEKVCMTARMRRELQERSREAYGAAERRPIGERAGSGPSS